MRIILTKFGEDLVTDINNNKKLQDVNKTNTIPSPEIKQASKTAYNFKPKSTSMKPTKIKWSIDLNRNRGKREETKEVVINQSKILIPKTMNEKYLSGSNNSQSFLPNLPENLLANHRRLMDKSSNTYSSIKNVTDNPANYFKGRELLSETAICNMKNSLKNKNSIKAKNSRIDENKFRTIYRTKSDSEKLGEMLGNIQIHLENMNLIKYLNEKNEITEQFVNRLSCIDEDEQGKLNKFCQLYFKKKDKESLFDSIVNKRLILKKKKELSEMGFLLNDLHLELDKAKCISSNYDMNFINERKRDLYIDLQNEFSNKYWEKSNVIRLQRKTANTTFDTKKD
jgi:hypothetical protein